MVGSGLQNGILRGVSEQMTCEIVITVLDRRIAELCKENIEHKTGYHCEIREGIINE